MRLRFFTRSVHHHALTTPLSISSTQCKDLAYASSPTRVFPICSGFRLASRLRTVVWGFEGLLRWHLLPIWHQLQAFSVSRISSFLDVTPVLTQPSHPSMRSGLPPATFLAQTRLFPQDRKFGTDLTLKKTKLQSCRMHQTITTVPGCSPSQLLTQATGYMLFQFQLRPPT